MSEPTTDRLVIRIRLVSQESAPPPPTVQRSSRGVQLAIAGGVVAILLGWFGIDSLESDPPPPPAAIAKAPTAAPVPKPIEPEQPDPPPSPVNEVVPDVPQSALDTIRGTIRVIVRVSIDKQGAVVAATADQPGPSRYFERLSMQAARKWTFTPARSEDRREMLVHFNFTRYEATASASPTPK
jgi:TonB family protein